MSPMAPRFSMIAQKCLFYDIFQHGFGKVIDQIFVIFLSITRDMYEGHFKFLVISN